MRALRTCRAWSVRPSEFWTEWSARDRTLALALDAFESKIGPNGFPRSLEEDPDQDGYFRAVPSVNYATKAAEQWAKQYGDKAEAGTTVKVVYERPNEEELSEYR